MTDEVREALEWAEGCEIRPDMVPFDVTRVERQFAKTLARAYRSLEAELAEANKQRDIAIGEARRLCQQGDQADVELRAEVDRLRAELDNLTFERNTLRGCLDNADASLAAKTAECEKAKQWAEALQSAPRIQTYRGMPFEEVDAKLARLESAESTAQALKAEVERLEADVVSKNDKIRMLEDDWFRCAKRYENAEAEVERLKAERDEYYQSWQHEKQIRTKDWGESLAAGFEAESEIRALREKLRMALAVLDQDSEQECESPKCGHEHICPPCMTKIRVRAELERPVHHFALAPGQATDVKELKFFCNHGKIDCPKCQPAPGKPEEKK